MGNMCRTSGGVGCGFGCSDGGGRAQADLVALGKPAGRLSAWPELVIFGQEAEPQLAYVITLVYDDPAGRAGAMAVLD